MIRFALAIMARGVIFLCYLISTIVLAILIVIGWLLIKLYNFIGWPEGQSEGNCWSYAVPKFLRGPTVAGLLISLSRWAPVLHVRYVEIAENVGSEEFVPIQPKRSWRGILDSFWFKGKVKRK